MIKYIVIALIAIVVLSYFGFDLKKEIESPTTQSNLSYVWSGVKVAWSYVDAPITYIWNKIIVGILWEAFINNLGRINAGAPTELEAVGERLINTGERGYVPLGQ